ncbi:MAG TPA: hypothetical protein DCR24_02915 [Bacillus bacterium]|nr:hypothetical protein [Bacillus sp. (in: firmicutes)]
MIIIEEQKKIRAKAEEEMKLEKARVSSCKINGFKDEVFNIYQQLEALTEDQVKINKELQEQLEIEQKRANKAERSLAEMAKWVSELKDKLYSEQNLFENQFKQMAERYGRFQSEINGCFINLEEQESLVFNGRTVRKTEVVSGV